MAWIPAATSIGRFNAALAAEVALVACGMAYDG